MPTYDPLELQCNVNTGLYKFDENLTDIQNFLASVKCFVHNSGLMNTDVVDNMIVAYDEIEGIQ
jgi:hypothetical protein